MTTKQEINTIAEKGRRIMPTAFVTNDFKRVSVMNPVFKMSEVNQMNLEYQNQILLNQLDSYHRIVTKDTDYAFKVNNTSVNKPAPEYNMKADYVNLLQEKINNITENAEKAGRVELVGKIESLQMKNEEQKELLSQLSMKFIRVKQKCIQMRTAVKITDSIIRMTKIMSEAMTEYEYKNVISDKLLAQIDLSELQSRIKELESQPKMLLSEKRKDESTALKAKETEIERKNAIISKLKQKVQSLSMQVDAANIRYQQIEAKNNFELSIKAENIKLTSLLNEVEYKTHEKVTKLETRLKEDNIKAQQEKDRLTNELREEIISKEGFKRALANKEAEYASLLKKQSELITREEKTRNRSQTLNKNLKKSSLMNDSSLFMLSESSKKLINVAIDLEASKTLQMDDLNQIKSDLVNFEALLESHRNSLTLIANLENEVSRLDSLNKNERIKIENLEIEKIKVETENDNLKSKMNKMEIENNEKERCKCDLMAEVARLENALAATENRVDECKRNEKTQNMQANEFKCKISELNTEVEKLNTKVNSMMQLNLSLSEMNYKQKEDIKIMESEVHELKTETSDLKRVNLDLVSKLRNREAEIEKWKLKLNVIRQNETSYNSLIKELADVKSQNIELAQKIKETKISYKKKIENANKMNELNGIGALERQLIEKETKNVALINSLNQKSEDIKTLRKRIEDLNRMQDERDAEQMKQVKEFESLSKLKVIYEEMKEGLIDYTRLKEDNMRMNRTNQVLVKEIFDLKENKEQMTEKLKSVERELVEKDQSLAVSIFKDKIKILETENKKLENDNSDFKNEIRTLITMKDALSAELSLKISRQNILETRIKEIDDFISGTSMSKPIQSVELQAAKNELEKVMIQKEELEFKLGNLESVNKEQLSNVNKLEMKIVKLKADKKKNEQLESLIESKNEQIFEIILNSNRKQSQIDEMEQKIIELEKRNGFESSERNRKCKEININEEESANSLSAVEIKENTPSELKYERKEQNDDAETELINKFKDAKALKSIIMKSEVGDERENINEQREPQIINGLENEIRMLTTRIKSLEIALSEKKAESKDLISDKSILEDTIEKARKELRECQSEVRTKEKENNELMEETSRLQLETKEASTTIEILELRAKSLKDTIDILKEEKESLSAEMDILNEMAFEGLQHMIFQLNQERNQVTKFEFEANELKKEMRHWAEKVADNNALIASHVDEIRKLKITISHQSDEIEVITRVNKVPEETIHMAEKTSQFKLQKKLKQESRLRLEKSNQELHKQLENEQLIKVGLRESLEKLKAESETLKSKILETENALINVRLRVVDKNNRISSLQKQNLDLTRMCDMATERIDKWNIENEVRGNKKEQIEFKVRMTKSEYFNYEREIRSLKQKLKVKRDKIKNLSENLKLLRENETELTQNSNLVSFYNQNLEMNRQNNNLFGQLCQLKNENAIKSPENDNIEILKCKISKLSSKIEKEKNKNYKMQKDNLESIKIKAKLQIELEQLKEYSQIKIDELRSNVVTLNDMNEELKRILSLKITGEQLINHENHLKNSEISRLKETIDKLEIEASELRRLNNDHAKTIALSKIDFENKLKLKVPKQKLENKIKELEAKMQYFLNESSKVQTDHAIKSELELKIRILNDLIDNNIIISFKKINEFKEKIKLVFEKSDKVNFQEFAIELNQLIMKEQKTIKDVLEYKDSIFKELKVDDSNTSIQNIKKEVKKLSSMCDIDKSTIKNPIENMEKEIIKSFAVKSRENNLNAKIQMNDQNEFQKKENVDVIDLD